MTKVKCSHRAAFVAHYPGRRRLDMCQNHILPARRSALDRGFHLVFDTLPDDVNRVCEVVIAVDDRES